jgi:hypothetical protein
MMADGNTLTKMTPALDIGNVPQWHVYDIAITAGIAQTYETDLETLPIGTVIVDLKHQCIVAEVGATSTVGHVRLETGPVVLLTGTADNVGSITSGATEVKELQLPSTFVAGSGLAAANILQYQSVCVGTSTTGGTARVSVLMFRVGR